MYSALYILPHQLYHLNIISNVSFKKIVLWEHPDFFTKYKFNKKKLILHRASMKKYASNLERKWKVEYIEYNQRHVVLDCAVMFDPINRMKGFSSVVQLESPNFLLTTGFLENVYKQKKSKTSIRFTSYFYPRAKTELGILEDTKSMDALNRKSLKSFEHKELLPYVPILSRENEKYVDEARQYVSQHFSNNYGTVDDFNFPIDHDSANKWFHFFLKSKLNCFGSYQDAILEGTYMLYHSGLSSSINIGLLQPTHILEEIRHFETKAPINSYEGFIRQLLWREYQRYCYKFFFNVLKTKNKFKLQTKLTSEWYTGETGVEPVDITIRKAFDTAYLHHIERLMIIGNFMLLSRINKHHGFRWFMEFSIDSYEWVMWQNVYDMVFFSTGGSTTHKAYISSSNYVLKMSDYKKGDWATEWDKKYTEFKKKTKTKKQYI